MINQTSRPAYLLAVQSSLPARGDTATALFEWIASVRGSLDVSVAADPLDARGYAALRRACARRGIAFLAVTPAAGPGNTPLLDQVAAPLASQSWACVEIVWAGSAIPLYRLPSPWPDQTVLAISLHVDTPPGAALLAAADLVLCCSQAEAGSLAIDPARCRVAGDAATRSTVLHAAMQAKQMRPRVAPPRRLLQVTPTYFGSTSTIGGGERYVDNLRRAVRMVAGGERACPVLSCGPGSDSRPGEGVFVLPGDVAAPDSFDQAALDDLLAAADVVHVHQCLTRFGLFVAARARLLGRPVIGTDHGGGQAPFLNAQPYLTGLFSVIQTYSAFGDLSAYDLPVPRHRILGPVDDTLFTLADDAGRDPALVVSVGRILPHKGFEAVIDALPRSLRLVIAGRPSDPAYLAHLHARAQGRDVTFEADLDDAALLALLHRAGLCIQASTHRDYLGRTIPKPELLGLAPLESLCTGLRTVVSAAGALGELGGLPGCSVAHAPGELSTLLDRYAKGELPTVPTHAIREAVSGRYGLAAFGTRYLAMVDGLAPCAS